MGAFHCDRCQKSLLVDEDTRYILKMVCYVPYDPMELTLDDLAKDHLKTYEEALEAAKEKDEKELSDEIYQVFKFDLCPPCRKAFAKNPLGIPK